MNAENQKTLDLIQSKFGVSSSKEYANELTVEIPKNNILDLCRYLHDDENLKYDYIIDICSVDFPNKIPRFEIIYHFFSIPRKHRIRIKAKVDIEDLSVDSVTGIWKGAEFMEDEAYDMMGIKFNNHPNLRRILMTDDYAEGYPLRKDFPQKGNGWRHDFENFMPNTEEGKPNNPPENSYWKL